LPGCDPQKGFEPARKSRTDQTLLDHTNLVSIQALQLWWSTRIGYSDPVRNKRIYIDEKLSASPSRGLPEASRSAGGTLTLTAIDIPLGKKTN